MSEAGVALVTGAAYRIGRVISLRLAEAGYALVLHANRSIDEAERLAGTLRSAGGRAQAIQGDLTDLGAIEALYARASEAFGPPDCLINNASEFGQDTLATLTPERFSRSLAINLQAPVLLSQAFAKALAPPREGVIIHLIDQRVLRPNPLFFSYTLAKSALLTATRTLAQSLAPRIRVNAVGPGPVLPNVHEGAAAFAAEASGTLLERAVEPEAIAEAIVFLARARNITGQMLAVDSGQHLTWQTRDVVGE